MQEPVEAAPLSDEQIRKVEEFIEEEEGSFNRYRGWLVPFLTAIAVASSAFHLYAAKEIVQTDLLREIHVGIVLFLSFMMFPIAKRFRHRLMWWDVVFALVSVAAIVWMIYNGDDFTDRNTNPTTWDEIFGIALIALVIEATRRTTGWVMPIVIGGFLIYAFVGPWLPAPWTHRGYDVSRLVGHMYMTLEGIFGTAVDVSATLIILFTIYGAFLQYSGAGKFFLDFSFSLLGGKPTSAGRAVVLASFLLGGPSGSGVATTVTIGTVAYPMLKKSGYSKDAAGGLLAAGGLGAILSPPVLGAAAFIIAEFLRISYLEVIKMATIPTLLYYFSLFLMVELDARKYGL
ncbi:MAG: TRAP transporter permease, partial [Usitatibacter sp.]